VIVLRNVDGTPHVPACDDAYVRVRVTDPVPAGGAVTVYLADGTALVVRERDLVTVARCDPAR
jgi:hypothetical protein